MTARERDLAALDRALARAEERARRRAIADTNAGTIRLPVLAPCTTTTAPCGVYLR